MTGDRHKRWNRAVALLFLTLGVGNLGKAGMALYYAALLPDLPMTVSWGYLMAMGAFWGVVLTACGVVLWRPRRWARWAVPAAATLYQLNVWLNHLLLDTSDYALQTHPRDLLLTFLFLAAVWRGLNIAPARRNTVGQA